MAVTVYKTFSAGEVLTAADLNASLTQFANNGTDVAFPLTKNVSAGDFVVTSLGNATTDTGAANLRNIGALTKGVNDFRLTLTSGTPVTTADVTAAETLYWAPMTGNCIGLYDGTRWHVRTTSELSIDVPDATNCYDVFCYDSSGTPTLELTAWTNTTTRATALAYQDGILCKTGALTRRYLGTFYCTTAGNGQIEDSAANRYLWNYYNRVRRTMARPIQGSLTYQYTTATYRQANANTGNQLNFVIGVAEDMVSAYSVHSASSSGAEDAILFYQAIGYDATNAAATGCCPGVARSNSATTVVQLANATYNGYPAVGAHYLSFLEQSTASGTTSWGGLVNDIGEGIYGELWG